MRANVVAATGAWLEIRAGSSPRTMARVAVVVLTLALAIHYAIAVCPEVVRQYIVSGQDAIDKDLLAFSALISDATGTCSATVIDDRHLLTAAHCSYSRGASVRVGVADSSGDAVASVVRFVSHPLYTSNSIVHDVAVVEIAPPLVNAKHVRLHRGETPAAGLYVRAAGYGVNTADYSVVSSNGMGTFRRVDIPVIGLSDCRAALMKKNIRVPPAFLASNYVCAGFIEPDNCGGDTCNGDSGGPLCIRSIMDNAYVQLGVTSAGSGCGNENVPGLYTSVAGHADWIAETVDGMVTFVDAFSTPAPPSKPPTPTPTRTPQRKSPPPSPSSSAKPVPVAPDLPVKPPTAASSTARATTAESVEAKSPVKPELSLPSLAPLPSASQAPIAPKAPAKIDSVPNSPGVTTATKRPVSTTAPIPAVVDDTDKLGTPAAAEEDKIKTVDTPAKPAAAESGRRDRQETSTVDRNTQAESGTTSTGNGTEDTTEGATAAPNEERQAGGSGATKTESTIEAEDPNSGVARSANSQNGQRGSLSNGGKGALIGVLVIFVLAGVASAIFFVARNRRAAATTSGIVVAAAGEASEGVAAAEAQVVHTEQNSAETAQEAITNTVTASEPAEAAVSTPTQTPGGVENV